MTGNRWVRVALAALFLCGAGACSKKVTTNGAQGVRQGSSKGDPSASCPGAIGDPTLAAIPTVSSTHSQLVIDSKTTLQYTLTTGYLPLYVSGTQSGTVRACLYYWAYTRDDQSANAATWPVTFLFNGGPTSSSDWIQFGGLAPKKLELGPEGITVPASPALVDDSNSLLVNSDLVFIDPINSGLSRPAKGVDPAEFNGLEQDADSVGDFIDAYLASAKRSNSPKYLVGESYAGMRIPVLARYLDEKLGIKLVGMTMISPWLDALGDSFGDDLSNDLPFVTYLPEYTTAAWYHQKLPADLQGLSVEDAFAQAVQFADTDYAEALIAGDDLPADQRTKVVAELSRFTSLTTDQILADNLRVPVEHFQTELLKTQNLVISQYDGRMAAVIADPTNADPTDAFNDSFLGAVSEALLSVGVTIGKTQYVDVYGPPTWPGANPTGKIEGGYLNVLDDLSAFVEKNPETKILVVNGLYDFSCPAAEVKYMLNHLSSADAARIQVARYEAGHPVYFGDLAHGEFSADLTAFYAGTKLPHISPP